MTNKNLIIAELEKEQMTKEVPDFGPGDTVVVPIRSNYQTPLNLYSTVSQVVFQSIASIAAFSTIFD